MSAHGIESWRPVVGYEGLYEVSDLGRVMSIKTGKLKSLGMSRGGYWCVNLWRRNRPRNPYVHRLVAEAFHAIPDSGSLEVNHIDGCKRNNSMGNLEWVTRQGNALHMCHVLGFKPKSPGRGESNHNARSVVRTDEGVEVIYQSIADAVVEGYRASCIVECCRGTQRTHRGSHWRYHGTSSAHISAINE